MVTSELRLYNTLTRKKEPFVPLEPDKVSLYTCGPTVYGPAHIGNLRTYVFEDVLRRWLRYGHGLSVKQVMNITDVEDKIIANSKATTVEEMAAYTEPFEARFRTDMAALNVEPAEAYPKATDYIGQMIVLIKRILKAGLAYEREGSVYFNVKKYHEDKSYKYGQLLNVDFAGFAEGVRIDADEYDKDAPQDFALWKSEAPDTPGWNSPWGYGRPGWHVECSAMVKAELGDTIDIHTGAVDNIFPHHENEIAQSAVANHAPLARFWLHGEHLLVDGAKMAKSAGNFYTLEEVTAKGFAPAVLRLLFLGAHYRSKLNFTWDSLAGAAESHRRIQEFLAKLAEQQGKLSKTLERVTSVVDGHRRRFHAAMDDDLNTAEALACLFDFVRDVNSLMSEAELSEAEAEFVGELVEEYDTVLGVAEAEEFSIPAKVQALLDKRQAVRDKGDFAASDQLREQIKKAGFEVEDTAQGQRVRKLAH